MDTKKKENLYETILAKLQEKFVRCEEIARVIALAIESQKNVLLWGPGGHGKSEMITEALEYLFNEDDIFVQSFGEGMDEATLWGGLDFAALENEKVLKYFPDQSFLAKPYAVFEEMFDAPASVLLALKDTLTARKLRKGSQKFSMKTKVIIAITNKDPEEVSELGPAAAALVERFPLQLNVKWDSYKSADYLQLFEKVAPFLTGADLNGTTAVLAELMAKASENSDPISPRSAVYALSVVKSAASLRSSNVVEKEDLIDLKFIDGLDGLAENIKAELEEAFKRAEAEKKLVGAEELMQRLIEEWGQNNNSPIKLLQVAKKMSEIQDLVSNLTVPDGLTDRRKSLRESVAEKITEIQSAALNATRV